MTKFFRRGFGRYLFFKKGVSQFFLLPLLLLLSLPISTTAFSEAYIIRFGPASLGTGGPNPLGIPPGITDIEFSVLSSSGFESNVGVPGLLFGQRHQTPWGGYVSFGGGVALDAHDIGPGIYTAFGIDFGSQTCRFNLEYKQAVGVGVETSNVINPYAVRFGGGIWFK